MFSSAIQMLKTIAIWFLSFMTPQEVVDVRAQAVTILGIDLTQDDFNFAPYQAFLNAIVPIHYHVDTTTGQYVESPPGNLVKGTVNTICIPSLDNLAASAAALGLNVQSKDCYVKNQEIAPHGHSVDNGLGIINESTFSFYLDTDETQVDYVVEIGFEAKGTSVVLKRDVGIISLQ